MSVQLPIRERLESARRDLLDLSARNRLLNTLRGTGRSGRLEIVDELSERVFRQLVQERTAMTFLPAAERTELPPEGAGLLEQPESDGTAEGETAARHQDKCLQTALASDSLQRRLLKLYYDARTFEEEQGVNILYLACGFLKWYEDDQSDRERFAPLLLVPVRLDRRSANARFRVQYTDEEISTNLSLKEKLKIDFGIELPEVPDVEDLSPDAYFAEVSSRISLKTRWQVLPNDMVLWFFSFSKFLMYRDLQPECWPENRNIESHGLVSSLLTGGFRHAPPICSDTDNIDRILQPLDMIHVLDADSSQAVAIEEVKQLRDLVIQGPPGTGKSQTIANLIATAVKCGRKVLFVAEKMAALEVVKRRLDNVGLGDMCLELHSNKANKRAVLEELGRTLDLGRPKADRIEQQAEELKRHRDRLNRHVEVLHTPMEPSKLTPYGVFGKLARLRAAGVPPADYQLPASLTWTAEDLRDRRTQLQDLALHLKEIGPPRDHPWRGVQLEAALPTEIDRLVASLPGIKERVGRLRTAITELASLLRFGTADTPLDGSAVAIFGQRIVAAPQMDRRSIADDVWSTRRKDIDLLVENGLTLAARRKELDGVVAEVGWSTDVSAARRHLAAHGRSWFRLFYREYREGMATLRGILVQAAPKSLDDRIQIFDRLIEGQKSLKAVASNDANTDLGRRAFGSLWRGVDSDWDALKKITAWEQECRSSNLPAHFREAAARTDDTQLVEQGVRRVAQDLKPLVAELQQVFAQLRLDLAAAFGVKDHRAISLKSLQSRLEAWQASVEALSKWISYYQRWRKLDAAGLGPLAERLDEGRIGADETLDRFLVAYYEDLAREVFRACPELAQFDGASHEQVRAEFKRLDEERLRMARMEVAAAHFGSLPAAGEVGEVGTVRKELKKKRKHLPLRQLLTQAGHAVQAIKPVFMMSPISVAQFLAPGILEFDLLVIDEASQVRPVDALGVVARSRQIVVVGDDRQLPPTQFFSRLVSDESDEQESEAVATADIESILGLCQAQGVQPRMLQWHYRSRHHSLIAVSNREFYGDRLFVVPSPGDAEGELGLRFHLVRDGVFDRGGSATNRVEAKAVVDAVMDHARMFPDRTLGVGAFSVAQRDAILDELELRRRGLPEMESFFATSTAEPFFVKNLENIQGDERDVIFISVGYGKDSSGYVAMNFGPLNTEGGERRLNVLISRARLRCDVFSSLTGDDIDLSRAKSRGAKAFKTFLKYAETGCLDVAVATDREFESEFESQVAQAVSGHGFRVDPQVGVAGFFVDLAVVDPACPGRYLLGIECDGASYHSSRSARDRDRLRQQVLEDRGWVIHRIWSTDWFHRPEEQLRKVLAAIENARSVWAGRVIASDRSPPAGSGNGKTEPIKRLEEDSDSAEPPPAVASVPYVEAGFSVDVKAEIHTLPVQQLAAVVARIVEIEGPVHQDEVSRRTASLCGFKRTGNRIASAVETALADCVHRATLTQHGLFYQSTKQQDVPIRNRENVASQNLRKPDYLPPAELRAALAAVAAANLGVTRDELVTEVARLLGFRSTGGQVSQAINDEIEKMLGDTVLDERNGKLYCEGNGKRPRTGQDKHG